MPFNDNDNEPLFCHEDSHGMRNLSGCGIFQNISEIAKSSSTGKQLILPVTMTCPKKTEPKNIGKKSRKK